MGISHFFLNRFRTPHVPPALFWSLVAVAVVALGVQATRIGVDVLVIGVLCVVVIVLERTLGDWLGEFLGAGWSSIVLAATIAIPVWYAFAAGGAADRFFSAAQRAGYRTLYYETSASPASPDQAASAGAPAPGTNAAVPTAGSSRPADRIGPSATLSENRPASSDARPAVARKRAVTPTMRLDVPEIGVTGSRIVFRAHVSGDGEPVAGASVAFTVNGRALETIPTDSNGVATAIFQTQVPRLYQIRAQLDGSAAFRKTSAAATLHILPARR